MNEKVVYDYEEFWEPYPVSEGSLVPPQGEVELPADVASYWRWLHTQWKDFADEVAVVIADIEEDRPPIEGVDRIENLREIMRRESHP